MNFSQGMSFVSGLLGSTFFESLGKCVCVWGGVPVDEHVQVCVYVVYVCMYACLSVVRGQAWILSLKSCPQCFLKQGLSLAWSSQIKLGWLPSKS